jgi:hypothetical protein
MRWNPESANSNVVSGNSEMIWSHAPTAAAHICLTGNRAPARIIFAEHAGGGRRENLPNGDT